MSGFLSWNSPVLDSCEWFVKWIFQFALHWIPLRRLNFHILVDYLFYPEIFTRNFYYRHFYPIYEQKSFFYGHFYLFYGQKSARYEHLPIKWKTNKLFKRNKEAIFSKITPLGNPFTKNKKLHFHITPSAWQIRYHLIGIG
jgi:hypothetical protein